MALDQYLAKEWKSISGASPELDNCPGCFDCNICLDFAHDPVVTLCGHLYCWPCIYKWFYCQQSDSLASDGHPQCPVCKAEISHNSVVPLYGRGQTQPQVLDEKTSPLNVAIPPRPPACGTQILTSTAHHGQHLRYHHNPYQNQQQYSAHPYSSHEEDSAPRPPLYNVGGNTAAMNVFHSGVGMFGEMVYARMFGNSQSLYTYPNSYHLAGSSSPRLRRQEMHADKSLNRISIFLLCCFLMCLLLF